MIFAPGLKFGCLVALFELLTLSLFQTQKIAQYQNMSKLERSAIYWSIGQKALSKPN